MFLIAAVLVVQQSLAADVRVASVTHLAAPLAWASPSLNVKGTVSPAPGSRLDIVVIALGAVPLDAEVGAFALLGSKGLAYAPIGIGGAANLIVPLDRLPIGQEVGQILPTDAILAVTRNSAGHVSLDAGPRATIALLFEVPAGMVITSLRLPGGRTLAVDR